MADDETADEEGSPHHVALGGSCWVDEASSAREMSWGTRREGRLVEAIVVYCVDRCLYREVLTEAVDCRLEQQR